MNTRRIDRPLDLNTFAHGRFLLWHLASRQRLKEQTPKHLWKYATLGSNDQGISDPWSRLWEAVQPWFGDTKDWRSQGLGKPRRLEHLGISIVSLFKG